MTEVDELGSSKEVLPIGPDPTLSAGVEGHHGLHVRVVSKPSLPYSLQCSARWDFGAVYFALHGQEGQSTIGKDFHPGPPHILEHQPNHR